MYAKTKEEENELLYNDLLKNGTEDTLMTVCEVDISKAGSQQMVKLGQYLAEEVKRSPA